VPRTGSCLPAGSARESGPARPHTPAWRQCAHRAALCQGVASSNGVTQGQAAGERSTRSLAKTVCRGCAATLPLKPSPAGSRAIQARRDSCVPWCCCVSPHAVCSQMPAAEGEDRLSGKPSSASTPMPLRCQHSSGDSSRTRLSTACSSSESGAETEPAVIGQTHSDWADSKLSVKNQQRQPNICRWPSCMHAMPFILQPTKHAGACPAACLPSCAGGAT